MDKIIPETESIQSTNAIPTLRTSPRTQLNTTFSPLSPSIASNADNQKSMIEPNPVIVQNSMKNISLKNKRKNFHPRCSALNEGVISVALQVNKKASLSPADEDRNLGPHGRQPVVDSNSDGNKYGSNINPSQLLHYDEESTVAAIDKKHYNSAVTTRILKNWQSLFDLQEFHQRQQQKETLDSSMKSSVDDIRQKGDSDRCHINQQQHMTAATTTSPFDRQLKNDFACNAFNAVQELLNVYGLSISPGDIVDAFKMQQQQQQLKKVETSSHVTLQAKRLQIPLFFSGECQQPPTPPRTPISSLQTTSAVATPTPSTSNNYDRKDDHGSFPYYRRVLDPQQQSISETDNLEKQVPETANTYATFVADSKIKSSATLQQNVSSKSQQLSDSSYRGHRKNFNSENNDSNDEFVGDECMAADNEDYKEFDENQKGFSLQSHLNNQFSDRFDDNSLANFYDMNHGYNDNDSNISSTIDEDHASSDDITMGGESAIFSEHRRSGEGSTGGDDECDSQQRTITNDESIGRLSVKNADSLLEKCSLNVFSPILQLAQIQNDEKQLNAEGMNYLTKFSSYHQCKTNACQVDNLREHYHCYDIPCLGKVFNKKEEVIRHLKWHKKRAESLNHGFLRFSSSDDCSLAFGTNCTHNRKQTHYHCFQPNCDKVYISTSDVQMHSNYHRKDSAIYQEGFQRYRATEECNAEYCMFAGQRTTHFHCRRDNCRYTFKNKADMEKHKSYHIKDLQLARDGFKKFLKTESCPYERCRFSRICNHIHCVRENCHYVLHSSGQLLSHKRKHERMDSEQAYRRFKIVQKAAAAAAIGIMPSVSSPSASGSGTAPIGTSAALGFGSESKASTPSTSSSIAISPELLLPSEYSAPLVINKALKHEANLAKHGPNPSSHSMMQPSPLDMSLFYGSSGLPLEIVQKLRQRHQQMLSAGAMGTVSAEDSNIPPSTSVKPLSMTGSPSLKASLPPFYASTASRSAMEEIEELFHQYFTTNCTRQANILLHLDQTEPLNLKSPTSGTPTTANSIEKVECHASFEPHLHCLFKNCDAIVPRNLVDISEHMQMHELNRNTENIIQNSNLLQITSIEGFFNRKRGRPPKNRVVEVYNSARNQSPQAIFTSFKLEKTLNEPLSPLACATPNQPRPANIVSSTITSQAANLHSSYASSASISLSSYIVTGRVQVFHSDTHKRCDSGNNSCPMVHVLHFHCKFSTKCGFATRNPLTMDQHISEEHIKQNDNSDNETTDNSRPKLTKHWELYDASTDCPSTMCIHRRKFNHFHCNKCEYTTIVDHEIENHTTLRLCNDRQCDEIPASENGAAPVYFSDAYHNLLNNNISEGSSYNERVFDDGTEKHIKPMSLVAESGQHREDAMSYGSLRESNNSPSPIKIETTSNEDEKISVVRAAGTYFPQNSNSSNDAEIGHPAQQPDLVVQPESPNNPSPMCQRPFCKLKRKPHRHCNLCNQAFSDSVKLEIHRLKHSTLCMSEAFDETEKDLPTIKDDANAEEESSALEISKTQLSSPNASPILNFSNATAAMAAAISSSSGLQQLMPQGFTDNLSMQNLHLAYLALYQQNPFYYQSFYPFLRSQNLPTAFAAHPELLQVHLAVAACNGGSANNDGTVDNNHIQSPLKSSEGSNPAIPYQFAATTAAAAATVSSNASGTMSKIAPNSGMNAQPFELAKLSQDFLQTMGRRKRKGEEYEGAPHELLEMSLGSKSPLVTTGSAKKMFKSNKQGNFKIFKDEPIPNGYLKFRFNEDCNFPNCGYRNHQSHFHCCRKDCYYSFCDKTRFVQHTARHERLDKLMGDDFKQYRASMRCGYEECVYSKNLAGQNNKSSHFHCLKCNFICSDTNKVVAHRRQHSKMEFIRMAGFRKVANNEKCNAQKMMGPSSIATTQTLSDQTESGTLADSIGSAAGSSSGGGVECTYSLKQTHYHCLVCDCSVLSRAQLGSHRHRMQ